MTSVRLKFIGLILVLAGLVFVGVGQGCGDFKLDQRVSERQTTSNSISDSREIPDFEIIPGAKTASTLYANQMLDNMAACANLTRPSAKTVIAYEDRKGALNEYGYAAAVTAPMLMSIVAVAGEVCNDLIEQERTNPVLFSGYDFAAAPNSNAIREVASRLALSCWHREATSVELEKIVTGFENVTNISRMELGDPARTKGATTLTRDGALMVCTNMLSALSAITY